MFGLMKMLRKEHYNTGERLGLSDLHTGCTVGFGFMPQRNISGCRMTVKAVNTYMFGEETFLAYVLDNDGTDVNLIVTTDETSKQTHLSLSQRIDAGIFSALFPQHEPQSWFDMKVGERVETSERVMGMQQSWIAASYRVAMRTRGSVVAGDKRLFRNNNARHFDAVILVDDTNEHALEAEKYEDGSLIVYSTVYRPVTDIGEISGPANHSRFSHVNDRLARLKPEEPSRDVVVDMIQKPADSGVSAGSKKEPAETRDVLALDAKLAVGVISEAQNNRMSIAALIRKVIDLPEIVNDQVMVNFSLSDAEYAELSERYHLQHSDHAGVKENIIKELRLFVGNKK